MKLHVAAVAEWNCMSPQWQNETSCYSSGRMKLVAECVCHHRVVAIFNNLNLINLHLCWLLGSVSQQGKCGWEGCKMIPAGCNVVDIRTNRYGQLQPRPPGPPWQPREPRQPGDNNMQEVVQQQHCWGLNRARLIYLAFTLTLGFYVIVCAVCLSKEVYETPCMAQP